MAYDRNTYMRQYMRERRAAQRIADGKAATRMTRMEDGLTLILDKLDGNTKPLAIELRAIATEALSDGK